MLGFFNPLNNSLLINLRPSMAKLQYKHYALALLTIVGVFSYIDRGLLALAMEPIKAEFQLSDGQLGLMSGFAFALFYAIAGIPIARWADRGNRNLVVTLTTGFWSAMLIFCGLAGSFVQLLLARVGLGVGEAGCVPTAQSLISDYFDRAERPRAISIYWLCGPISALLSFMLGGWLIDQLGWRTTFIVVGLPGVLVALVVKMTLREPRLEQKKIDASEVKAQPSMKNTLSMLWQQRTLRHIFTALCVSTFLGHGIFVWLPVFYMRSHGMETTEIGIWLGLIVGIAAMPFTYLSGYLATRYAAHRESLQMKGAALAAVLSGAFFVLCCLTNYKVVSLLMLIGFVGFISMMAPLLHAAIQGLVEERVRAVTLACLFMLTHLIGTGVGPVVLGLISDQFEPMVGQESLRYALLLFSPLFLWCAYHAWKSAVTVEEDIRAEEKMVLKREKSATEKNEIDFSASKVVLTDA